MFHPCDGRHRTVEVQDEYVIARCEVTGETLTHRRCVIEVNGVRCAKWTRGTRVTCYQHRDERIVARRAG